MKVRYKANGSIVDLPTANAIFLVNARVATIVSEQEPSKKERVVKKPANKKASNSSNKARK